MWRNFYLKPFEVAIGIFVVVNAILAFFHPGITGAYALISVIGGTAYAVWGAQLVAGLLKLYGIACAKTNLEVAGLCMVTALFTMKGLSILTDGSLEESEYNALVIAILIVISNIIKIHQVVTNWTTVYIKAATE